MHTYIYMNDIMFIVPTHTLDHTYRIGLRANSSELYSCYKELRFYIRYMEVAHHWQKTAIKRERHS